MDAPADGLSTAQNKLFLKGAEEFDEGYHTDSGLGPLFVSTSCTSCHSGDNRGHISTVLTRFGQEDTTGNKYLKFGGPQLQNRAIPGFNIEQIPAGATSTVLIAPIVSGTGFLEAIPDLAILDFAEENKTNKDGVRGHPCWISLPPFIHPALKAISQNGKYIGRFGRKASTYNLLQQTVTAFNQDMGITSTYLPLNPTNYMEGIPGITNPEVNDQSIDALVFYLQTLQVPVQRNREESAIIEGKILFTRVGCDACHRPTLKTGQSPIKALSEVEIHPYTDLLVHDMGPGLDDHYTEGNALTAEWRTTPLWGLGLADQAQGGKLYLLHDGRATSIEQAILFHGGESKVSVDRYTKLNTTEKTMLLTFLKSL